MSVGDWIGLGIVALVIVGGLVLLNQITKPYGVKTEEEFQRRRKEGPGLLNAAMLGLQQTLDLFPVDVGAQDARGALPAF